MKYSEKELWMFNEINPSLAKLAENDNLEPLPFYRILIEDVFINDKTGNAVESLRRAYVAYSKGCPYRLSEHFDSLIY